MTTVYISRRLYADGIPWLGVVDSREADECNQIIERDMHINANKWRTDEKKMIKGYIARNKVFNTVPLKDIPTNEHPQISIEQAFACCSHSVNEILSAYIDADVCIDYVPFKYRGDDITDDIFELYCKAARKNLLQFSSRDGMLTRRLILATSDVITECLTFVDMNAIDSYILAHMPLDNQSAYDAPDALIARAYRLGLPRN